MNPSVQSDDKRFLELLERWVQGEFTRADERELHALADADNFRREALEGFSMLPEENHRRRLAQIRARFLKESIFKRLTVATWAAAAAVLILLSVAVYFVPKWMDIQQNNIAQTKSPEMPGPAAESVPVLPPAETPAATGGETKAPLRSKSLPSKANEAPASPVVADDVVILAEENNDKPVLDAASGTVTGDVSAKPSPAPPVVAGGPAANQQIFPVYPDTGGKGAISNLPYSRDVVPTRSVSDAESERPKEITQQTKAESVQKKSKTSEAPVTTAPVGGWDNFQVYLRRNARLTQAARDRNVSGNVRLQFVIGPDGKPTDVKVLRSLGYGCDEQAIQLVSAVLWIAVGNEPVTVDIPFVR